MAESRVNIEAIIEQDVEEADMKINWVNLMYKR